MPCFTYYSWHKPHIVLQLLRKADSGVTTCHGLFAQSHSWKQSQREAKVGMVPAPPPAVSPPTLAPPPSGWCCSSKSGTGELLEGQSPSLPPRLHRNVLVGVMDIYVSKGLPSLITYPGRQLCCMWTQGNICWPVISLEARDESL